MRLGPVQYASVFTILVEHHDPMEWKKERKSILLYNAPLKATIICKTGSVAFYLNLSQEQKWVYAHVDFPTHR